MRKSGNIPQIINKLQLASDPKLFMNPTYQGLEVHDPSPVGLGFPKASETSKNCITGIQGLPNGIEPTATH